MEIEDLSRLQSAPVVGGDASDAQGAAQALAASRTIKLVVYTAIVGDYDDLVPPPVAQPRDDRALSDTEPGVNLKDDITYVCLTDVERAPVPGWTYRVLPRSDLSAQSRNRWAKFHPHELFPEHNASIYVDGNVQVLSNPMPLAVEVLQQAGIGLYDHPVRTCLYEEARECARIGFDWSPVIREQVQRYALDGFPPNAGLLEGNVIVRAHHDVAVRCAMERWWDEWDKGVKRDQLSLMYVLWKEGLNVHRLGRHDGRFINRYFRYQAHRQPMTRPPRRILRQLVNRADLFAFGI